MRWILLGTLALAYQGRAATLSEDRITHLLQVLSDAAFHAEGFEPSQQAATQLVRALDFEDSPAVAEKLSERILRCFTEQPHSMQFSGRGQATVPRLDISSSPMRDVTEVRISLRLARRIFAEALSNTLAREPFLEFGLSHSDVQLRYQALMILNSMNSKEGAEE